MHERGKLYETLHKSRTALQGELDSLISYLHRELIDEDDFRRRKNSIKTELATIDEQLRGSEQRAESLVDMNERAFNFAVNARKRFKSGDVVTKRDILRTLGLNIILKDNKLLIEPNEWLAPIA